MKRPKKKIVPTSLMKVIIPYSPIKINENKTPWYSVLNPDTNSDSASEKSNGVRLDSPILNSSHMKNIGISIGRAL